MKFDQSLIQGALKHIQYLSQEIGGRGSCTPSEKMAAEYTAEQMREMGLKDVHIDAYQGSPSTYRPYALAFSAALTGTLLVWLAGTQRWSLIAAAILNGICAWGMLAETDFAGNWMRLLLPKAVSHNATGVISPSGNVRRRAVLCAHIDTHRTPIFYSSKTWHKIFNSLVALAFISIVAGTVVYGIGALFVWKWTTWIGIPIAAVQIFALALCIHADFTPFSPGANDDASGVGVILDLADALTREPLKHTEVRLAFTGCEETGAYGIGAFLDKYSPELGKDAVYLILDEVGLGKPQTLTADGLIIKRKTHPGALSLSRRAAASLVDFDVFERVGIAYTDAAVATKRGLVALTISAVIPARGSGAMHWHQMTDTIENVDPHTLSVMSGFTWQVLQEIDRESNHDD